MKESITMPVLLERLDLYTQLHQQATGLHTEMVKVLQELVAEQRIQGEQIAKIAQWIALQKN